MKMSTEPETFSFCKMFIFQLCRRSYEDSNEDMLYRAKTMPKSIFTMPLMNNHCIDVMLFRYRKKHSHQPLSCNLESVICLKKYNI